MHNYIFLKKLPQISSSIKKFTFILCCIFLTAFTATAQVPTNDEPCNGTASSAITLIADAACSFSTFSNVDASNSTTTGIPNPTCANFTDADVWFKTVVPTGATSITIDTKNMGMTDGGMAVYRATGTCPTLTMTEVACADDGSTNAGMPKLTVTVTAGETIYIRMWGFGGETGTFGICVTANIPPTNDNCINATTLTVNPDFNCGVITAGTTNNATQSNSFPDPTCGTSGGWNDDVWFSFIATNTSHRVTLPTVSGATSMTMVAYSGTCSTLTQVGCINGNTLNLASLTVGDRYLIRVYTNVITPTVTATFNICVGTPPPPPINDNCAGAINLTVNANLACGVVTAGTTVSATSSGASPVPGCGVTNARDDDVWFTFTATTATHTISLLNITGGTTAMVVTLNSGICGALTELQCSTTNLITAGGLTPGTVYYVRVFTNVATFGVNSNFNICVGTPPPPPPNDECVNATVLTVNPDYNCGVVTAGTTISATLSTTTPTPTCSATGGWNDDVWYSFVATNVRHRVSLSNVTGTTDMATSVYSGTCGTLVQLACTDPDPNVINLIGLIPGATYYVRVMTWTATATSTASFNICVGTAPPPPPNDDCLNATNLTVNPNYLCGVVTAGTTVSATQSVNLPAPTCTALNAWDDDVWYTFTATNATHRISLLNITGTTTGLTSVVYSGNCLGFTQISCNSTNLYNVAGLTPGTVYYIRVFSTTTTVGLETNFNICVGTPPPPPPNDECTGAISLTVNANQLCGVTTVGSTAGATQSSTTPTPTCSPANGWDDDVWYSFVAASNNHTVSLLNVNGTTTNMATSVYAGTCGSLIQIACATVDPNFINLSTLTPGNTYYVRVQTEQAGAFDATFTICVGTPGPGAVCASGNPFCSTSGVVYPSVTGQPSLGQIDCLLTTPNPTWFAFQVSTAGNLVFQVSQTASGGGGIDVDYAAWGPFTSQAAGCTSIAANPVPTVSCSYSTAAIETITIPNAQVGQWYVVLITNFNGGAGTIAFNTTTGNVGSTNCNIVCNTTAANNGPVCPGGSFNLTSTALSGSTFSWTGPNGFTSTAQNPTNVIAPTTPGSYVYNVTTTSGSVSCPGSTTVVVTAPPAAPTVVSPLTYCQGSTAPPLTATGTNLLWYLIATGGTGSTTAPTPSTATIGSTSYYVSQSTGTCEGPRASITVNITASTTPQPEVITPVNYCQGATATALTASGTNLLWYTSSTGGTGSTTAPIPSTATVGSTVYYVSQTQGTCESPRASITVNITAASAAPTVVTPVNYCQGATAIPLTAVGVNLLWYTTLTGGTGSTTAPTPSTTTAGTTIFYVTQNTNGCPSARTPISVIITATPAAPTVVSPVNYCQNTTATPLTATGTNLLWYLTATGGLGSPVAPTPQTLVIGTTNYYVSQSNGNCEGPRSTIVVNVTATLPAPAVTSPVNYCQNATAVPLTATGTNLLWYTTATGGAGSTTAPTPLTTTVGSTNYYVSQGTGSCESVRSTITVNVNPASPQPIVTTPVTYCQGATAMPLSATGTNLMWYTTATGGTGSTTAPTPSTAIAGTTLYYVTQTTASCPSSRAVITVNVTATPAAPTVVTPVTYCQGATATALTATGTNLLWYTVATSGTGSASAPTPSTATAGTTNYYVSQSPNGCEGPRATIAVTINATPAAPTVTTPVTYCQGATAVALTASGTNLMWYTTSTGGTGSSTAPIPSTTTVGNTIYYVSQTSASNCEGPRASITVTVNSTPAAPMVSTPVNYCQNSTATPLTATGTNLMWYTVATGGTGSTTAPTPSTTTAGTTNYYVSQTTGTCEGPRATIAVVVTALPTAPTVTTPVTYCQGATAVPLTATGTNLMWYTVATGGTGSTTAPTPQTTTVGTNNYYVSQATGTCEGPRALIAVIVNARPGAPTAANSTINYCQNAAAAVLTATGTNLMWYTVATGGTGTTTAPTPPTTTSGTTVYYVSQSTGACEGPRTAITVNVTPALFANAGATSTPVVIASGQTIQLQGSGTAGANILWTSNITPLTLSNPTILTPIASPLQTTQYTLTVSDPTNLCPSATSSITINVVTSCINVRNAFTPNGDGINDFWLVYDQSVCLRPNGVNATVFNRYGTKVFEAKGYVNKWDGTYKGKPLPDGTYYAVIEFTLSDGTKRTVKSDVTILR